MGPVREPSPAITVRSRPDFSSRRGRGSANCAISCLPRTTYKQNERCPFNGTLYGFGLHLSRSRSPLPTAERCCSPRSIKASTCSGALPPASSIDAVHAAVAGENSGLAVRRAGARTATRRPAHSCEPPRGGFLRLGQHSRDGTLRGARMAAEKSFDFDVSCWRRIAMVGVKDARQCRGGAVGLPGHLTEGAEQWQI